MKESNVQTRSEAAAHTQPPQAYKLTPFFCQIISNAYACVKSASEYA